MDIFGQFFLDQSQNHADDHIGIFSFSGIRNPGFVVQGHTLAAVDVMGIHDNITLRCLTEDPVQPYHRKTFGLYNVLQDASRPQAEGTRPGLPP